MNNNHYPYSVARHKLNELPQRPRPFNGLHGRTDKRHMSHPKTSTKLLVKRMPKHVYEEELERLQIQLVSMQQWVIETGARVVVIFEGRDAAGKGGAIKRIMQYLNPRFARVAALPTPNEREKTQ